MSGHKPRGYFLFLPKLSPLSFRGNLSLDDFMSPRCLCLKGLFIVVSAEDLDTECRSVADAQVEGRRLYLRSCPLAYTWGRRAHWLAILRVGPAPHGCVHGHVQ